MQVFVRTVAGKTITVHIDPTSTVRSLAQQICEKEGLPTEIVRLVYGGKQMGRGQGGQDTLLTDHNIQKECTIHVIIRNSVSQELRPITNKLQVQIKLPSATGKLRLDIDKEDKIWNVKQRLRLMLRRGDDEGGRGLYTCDSCELRHKGLNGALDDEMTVTQAKVTSNTTLVVVPDTVYRAQECVVPQPSAGDSGRSADVKVLTLQQTAELLASERTREQQLTDAAVNANEYLEQMRKKAVMLRRFCVTEGSQPAEIATLVRKSLAALEGRAELYELQLAASEATEWQMKAHSEQVTARRLEQELSTTEEALATNQQRLQQLEASVHHSRQAALAAAAVKSHDGGGSGESEALIKVSTSVNSVAEHVGTNQQQVIAEIRQEKMLDQDVPADMVSSVASLRAMCGRALEKLSKDLYAHEGHFFHELLQNCDDNSYAESTIPTIKLGVTPEAIFLLNNELGFTDKDVRSICDLGASTKVDSSSIGRKGIGFKSVFMVSDSPHIISGDWSFRFDVQKHGLYGYVCPEWIDRTVLMKQLPVAVRQDLVDGNSRTCFWLPRDRAKAAMSNLHIQEQLDPATLLFLRKIRQLVIEENGVRRKVSIEHQHDGSSKSEVNGGIGTGRDGSLRICQLYDVSEPAVEEPKRDTATSEPQQYFQYTRRLKVPPHLVHGSTTSAELSVAFTDSDTFEPQNFFTFLPVCCAGFPFLLHGTFELVSSRQALRADSAYNLWLRDQIAPTFSMAMDTCDQLRERLPGLLAALHVVDPFWRPVVRGIMKAIRGTACIQTESSRWVCPDKAILRPDSVDEELVNNSQLKAACNLEFVNCQMNDMAQALGCSPFGLTHMVAVVRQMFDDVTAEWTRALLTFLNNSVGHDDVESIWDLKMFEIKASGYQPQHVQRGRFNVLEKCADRQVARTSLQDGAIFASIPDEWQYVLQTGAVRVLSRDFIDHTREEPECAKLLETCGITVATPQAVARNILNQHVSGTFANEAQCWHGLHFIRDHLSEILCNDVVISDDGDSSLLTLRDLRSALCIPNLSHGVLMSPGQLSLRGVLGVNCPCCASITKMSRLPRMEQPIKPTRECKFVGSARITCIMPKSRISVTSTLLDDAKWDAFFVLIGVNLHSSVCTKQHCWTDCAADETCAICLESLPRSQASSILPCSHRFHPECILKWSVSADQSNCPMCRASADLDVIREVAPDPIFTELSSALGCTLALACSSPPGAEMLAKTALEVLATDPDTRSALGSVLVPTSMGRSSIKDCWDPSMSCNRGGETPMNRLLPRITLPGMSESDPELTAIFTKLGMCTTSTIDGLLHAARVMRQQVIDGANVGPTIILQAFASLYTAMHAIIVTLAADDRLSLQRHFKEQPIIFCGESKFCCTDEVMWTAESAVVQAVGTCTLQSLYGPVLEPFWVDTIGVKSAVGARAYWSALTTLCDEYERDPQIASRAGYAAQLTEQVTLIYEQLEKLLRRGGDTVEETMAAAGFDRSNPISAGGICLLVRWRVQDSARRIITRVVRLSALTTPVFLNDDQYCYDIISDSIESWLVREAFVGAPSLLRELCSSRNGEARNTVQRLSASILEQGDVVIAEPISRESQWTMWARQFVEIACAEYCQRPSSYALRLASTVTVLNADSISSMLTVGLDGMQTISKSRNYSIITDQESGRIILSRQRAGDAPAVCRCLARQLSGLLAEMHASSGEAVFEWNAYAFLMRHCGLQPQPLAVLDRNNDRDRIGGFYRPSGSGGPRARTGGPMLGTGPRFSFPASLPKPAELQVPPQGPLRAIGQRHPMESSQNTIPTAIVREGDARELGVADRTTLLQQQVTALQAQLAQQQELLAASRQTIAALEIDRDAACHQPQHVQRGRFNVRSVSQDDRTATGAGTTTYSPARPQSIDSNDGRCDGWACEYCTFINARPLSLVCEMCEQQRTFFGVDNFQQQQQQHLHQEEL